MLRKLLRKSSSNHIFQMETHTTNRWTKNVCYEADLKQLTLNYFIKLFIIGNILSVLMFLLQENFT